MGIKKYYAQPIEKLLSNSSHLIILILEARMSSYEIVIVKDFTNFYRLVEIEKKAAEKFIELGLDSSKWLTLTTKQLDSYFKIGQLWVAVNHETPLGFLACEIHNNYAHIEELDVDPIYMQQGIARLLIKKAITWAR